MKISQDGVLLRSLKHHYKMDHSTEKIARILRVDKHTIEKTIMHLEEITGKKDVLKNILDENEKLIEDRMLALGVRRDAPAKEVYDALISKIESDDFKIFNALGSPSCKSPTDCHNIGQIARKVVDPPKGLFLKVEKAKELVVAEPPQKIMDFLGYKSAEEMVGKEDIFEIFAALRFLEGSEWLNAVFFKQYEKLTAQDFEERDIQVIALSPKWDAVAQRFVEKKKHNISHLKELGIIFIIPALLGISGEILRMFILIMHYLYEIPYYSSIIKEISQYETEFPRALTSILRGDVSEERFGEVAEKSHWLVVQRYLAKEDLNDWRLFVPHINPEAIHWRKAEESIYKVGDLMDGFSKDLMFWSGLSWVGDYFKDESGVDVLVSFNLVDTVMSLVKQKEMTKYLYHQEEALWNKIFTSFFDRKMIEEYSRKYLLQGYFEV